MHRRSFLQATTGLALPALFGGFRCLEATESVTDKEKRLQALADALFAAWGECTPKEHVFANVAGWKEDGGEEIRVYPESDLRRVPEAATRFVREARRLLVCRQLSFRCDYYLLDLWFSMDPYAELSAYDNVDVRGDGRVVRPKDARLDGREILDRVERDYGVRPHDLWWCKESGRFAAALALRRRDATGRLHLRWREAVKGIEPTMPKKGIPPSVFYLGYAAHICPVYGIPAPDRVRPGQKRIMFYFQDIDRWVPLECREIDNDGIKRNLARFVRSYLKAKEG